MGLLTGENLAALSTWTEGSSPNYFVSPGALAGKCKGMWFHHPHLEDSGWDFSLHVSKLMNEIVNKHL